MYDAVAEAGIAPSTFSTYARVLESKGLVAKNTSEKRTKYTLTERSKRIAETLLNLAEL